MIFTSHFFLLYFFPIFLLVYLVLARKIKYANLAIIIFSLIFYVSFGIENLPILIVPLILNYIFGRLLFKIKKKRIRRIAFIASIALDLLILAYFKYFNFFLDNIRPLLNANNFAYLSTFSSTFVPLGISFITFQRISYIFDIYRKKIKPSSNFIEYATYASVFPHLISGPIVRYTSIRDELKKRVLNKTYLFDGFKYFVVGLFLKIMIADRLFIVENLLKQSLNSNHFLESVLLITYFSLRIYLDFTGYSLIAVGLAKFMGFDFPMNFNAPYRASGFRDFWSRWNITLSGWLRDYLYIPLGGNRKGKKRTYLNLVVTMLLGGLWHGANWNFMIWGGLHGIYLAAEHYFDDKNIRLILPQRLKQILVFIVISLTWMTFLFRQPGEILTVFSTLIKFQFIPLNNDLVLPVVLSIPSFVIACIWCIFFKELDIEKIKSNLITSIFLLIIFFILLQVSISSQSVPFIYFQF